MGMLDGLLGGAVGAEMVSVVNSLVQQHGGVQGLVTQLQQGGLGGVVSSWIGTGANQSVTASQLNQALGSGVVGQLAAKAGLSPQDLLQKLTQVLPAAVDHLTPGGTIPPHNT
ncbi:MAG: DUF937 domain-containing protein [Proteobacteria bacterium]|nr:DUF937 domain-containing protein [Pseudomonadota bacterium]